MSSSLFGRALDDITGPEFDFRELVHADDLPGLIQAISAPTDDASSIDVEFRILHGVDGATWVRCMGMNTGPEDGVSICDLRMVDVEARVAISEERSRLQTLLNLVLDNVPLMISVRDAEQDCFIHVNRMFQKIANRPRAEIIGQGTTGILGIKRSEIRRDLTRKVVEERQIVEFPEVEIDMPLLGRRIFKSAKYPIFDEGGTVRYIVSITDDITDRRHSEEALRRNETRLHDAIESFSDAIALFDAEDRLVFCNSRYTRLWPRGDFEIRPGQTYEYLVRAYAEQAVRHGVDMDMEAFIAKRIDAHRNLPLTNHTQLFDGTWVQIDHRRTSEGGIVITGTDITSLKEREEMLRDAGYAAVKAKEAAEIANQSKSDFLANMSHELRTPLNAVIGFSEIIRDLLLGDDAIDQYRAYAKDIHDSGRHLLELINDLLDMSKIEAGKLELEDEPIHIPEAIELALRLVRDRADLGKVRLICDIEENLPQMRGDMRKVKQIVINLLSNAVKFTPEGGTVATTVRRAGNGDFIVEFSDTGIGISQDDMPKVLEAFGQAKSGLNRKYEGTGLGINLAKALTELHDGELMIRSAVEGPEKGTTVTVRFPACRAID